MSVHWKAGDHVEHSVFGKGVVVGYKPHTKHEIDGGAIVIDFENFGSKELMTSFCGDRLKLLPPEPDAD